MITVAAAQTAVLLYERSGHSSIAGLAEDRKLIVGFITELAVGSVCVIIGLLIWKRQKVSLVHEYHYKNVKNEDIPAYSRLLGIGLISIGIGVCVTGLLNLLKSTLWWVPMLIGFVAGFIVMNKAQKKYNGSWFS